MYTNISRCRICGNTELDSLLDLGMQALTGVFPKDRETDMPKYPLELVKCRDDGFGQACGLVQLKQSFQPDAMYGMNYGYRSGLNRSMVDHLQKTADKIKSKVSLTSNDLILDIGSNDSTLLRAIDSPGLNLIGMDPTGVKFRQYYPPHITLIPDFFSAARFQQEFGQRTAKVVTSIAMFYDLEAPLEFVKQIYEILAEDGVWIFEQSYLPTMLSMTSYDTICHEHAEYYAFQQILWMLDRVGFAVIDVELNDTNGGSFSVMAAKKTSSYARNEVAIQQLIRYEATIQLNTGDIYDKFRDRVFKHRDVLQQFLRNARNKGEKILGYGASTKGNVILQFCGITAEDLPCIAEVNNDKFGAFTPGTIIPIVSEQEARSMNPSGFLVFPWHFRDSIIARESRFLASGGKLIFPLPRIEVVEN
jgi:NDP-4-keto-2,6-dideoxyhexose 3-C-methyltransferase